MVSVSSAVGASRVPCHQCHEEKEKSHLVLAQGPASLHPNSIVRFYNVPSMRNYKMNIFKLHLVACLLVLTACSSVLAENGNARHAVPEDKSSHNYQRKVNAQRRGSIVSLSPKEDFSEGRSKSLWDDGLLISSSGSRKDKKVNDRNSDDEDDKKTLSQQVKEGKYGLIQNEIFATDPKRPGIVSYATNPDTPKDTIKNFGGLDEDEIWLAENHVLVLRGGKLPDEESQDPLKDEKWPPIDDYQAPRRQVKIPARPMVPPPFPVQLVDGGPIEILGASEQGNNGKNETLSRGFLPGEGPFFPLFSNQSTPFSPALSFVPVNTSKGSIQFKPIIIPDKLPKLNSKSKDEDPSLGPFYPALPPGAVIVPPPGNRTDYDDEEDQSIYYPPPYSFIYDMKNDSSSIPPGPLVPGIILPPPPDFFSTLDEAKKPATGVKDKYKRIGPTPSVGRPSNIDYLPRKTNAKVYKSSTTTITSSPQTTTQKSKLSSSRPSTFSRYNPKTALRKQINNTAPIFIPRTVLVEVTTPSSIKSTTFDSTHNYDIDAVVGNQVTETSTEKDGWTAVVSSKSVPLLAAYYATTTSPPPPTPIEQQIETTPSPVKINVIPSNRHSTRIPDQTSYFFYGEPNNEATGSSDSNDDTNVFYGQTTTESSTKHYKVDEPIYNRVEDPQVPQRQTSIKLLESLVKDPRVYQYSKTTTKDRSPTSQLPGVQSDRASSLYYSTISTDRSPSTRNSYLTATPEPQTNAFYQDSRVGVKFDYEQKGKPKPIYQYSFEAADYNKERKLGKKKKQQQSERELVYEYPEEGIIQNVNERPYGFANADVISEQLKANRYAYKSHQPIEYFAATTVRSPADSSTTLEPHRVYITKQDEQLLDDVTKEYFTMFGKKLTNKRVQSTTPIYRTSSVTENPKYTLKTYVSNDYSDKQPAHYKIPKVKVHYGGQTRPPYSLEGDTIINYKNPLPPINPDSEFITVIGPDRPRNGKLVSQPIIQEDFRVRQVLQSDNQVRDYTPQPPINAPNYGGQRILQQSQQQQQNDFIPMEGPRGIGQRPPPYPTRPVSLAGDIAVNYQNPRPPLNPDAEFIGPMPGQPVNRYRNKPNSYFAYSLPGDGGHFYFLTPQAIAQRQGGNSGYLYSSPRVSRLVRRRRGPT